MDTQTIEAAERRLKEARETLADLVSRRVRLTAELDELVAKREDAHFDALVSCDHAALERLIAMNRKISALRDEHRQLRATLTATLAPLQAEAKQ